MVKLLYGLNKLNSRMISIMDSQNGLACECICVACDEALIAKQGLFNKWHFAHKSDLECRWAPETALHELAKQVVADHNHLVLPNGEIFQYSEVKVEKKLDSIVPDVWIGTREEGIAVEIFVTHEIEPKKEHYFISNNMKAVEIDLSRISRDITEIDLIPIIITESGRKRMVEASTEKEVVNDDGSNGFLLFAILMALILLITGGKRKRRKNG